MQIVYRQGDVIDADEPVLVHGCNALGEMGSGVALQVRKRLYFAYAAYRQHYLLHGLRLGEVIWGIDVRHGERPRLVGNAITQQGYGSGPTQYVSYDAVRMVMQHIDVLLANAADCLRIAAMPKLDAVAMPMIGAGRGGGRWEDIATIIEAESQHFQPVVYRRLAD
jgi:O-acetyl-ADP-ribose deacetylase (regulator of RNase III)